MASRYCIVMFGWRNGYSIYTALRCGDVASSSDLMGEMLLPRSTAIQYTT
jgi:hypothetical protein